MKSYYIHDNYNKPYRVDVTNSYTRIYHKISNSEYGFDIFNDIFNDKPVLETYLCQIFIGKSALNKMTEYSGAYGKEYNGNTILIELDEHKYIYIGRHIVWFQSLSTIVEYHSPIGYNDVPYPYALDEEGNCYLMIEDVILDKTHDCYNLSNPYEYYYSNQHIINNEIVRTSKPNSKLLSIKHFYIGTDEYNLSYTPNADENYEWLESDAFRENNFHVISIETSEKCWYLTKKWYREIMEEFGNIIKFIPLNTNYDIEYLEEYIIKSNRMKKHYITLTKISTDYGFDKYYDNAIMLYWLSNNNIIGISKDVIQYRIIPYLFIKVR